MHIPITGDAGFLIINSRYHESPIKDRNPELQARIHARQKVVVVD